MECRRFTLVALTGVAFASLSPCSRASAGMIDLTGAAIVTRSETTDRERTAVKVLRSRVEKQTGLRLASLTSWPEERRPIIALGLRSEAKLWAGPLAGRITEAKGQSPHDGYQIVTNDERSTIAIAGNDPRGLLFGVGRLLRELRMSPGRFLLPEGFAVNTAPKVALRGHQLGYRPKTNSYDGWDVNLWEEYIEDLSLFGTNAVELLPPRTDDDADSPHFPLPPMEMMVNVSGVCDRYGLDVWVWFPALDADYVDPAKVTAALKEWGEVFRKLSRLDAVFVPGGDPGHTRPAVLMAFLEKVTALLHESHPKAQMWVSPQGFNAAWMDEFHDLLKAEPSWLTGVVFGPQVRTKLADLRKSVPSRYPIRGYPDITHSRQCQHPVPDWDLAFAVTEGREAINPRPLAEAAIFKEYRKNTVGFITYSEGCNDDVNKFVWSALGWEPDADVAEILRQYGRVFLDDRHSEGFAQALLGLERNWSGPLLTNSSVETTLRQLQDMEQTAGPKLKRNWRFQQALCRGYYDASLRDRLVYETSLESQAMGWLRRARSVGPEPAMSKATEVMNRAVTEPVSGDRRARVFELAEALFQSIHMQLSVSRYQAIAAERGANLDTIDVPLNNRVWLTGQFAEIRAMASEAERLRALDALVNRTDPGPGGFYDDLGDPAHQPHLVVDPAPESDPLLTRATFVGFALRADWPTAWRQYAQTYFDSPIRLAYEGLDPRARYTVRVTYAGDNLTARMRLEADGSVIHDWLKKPNPVRPVEFEIPAQATTDGRLRLSWTREPGLGGNGRGCQVAEVWLFPSGR